MTSLVEIAGYLDQNVLLNFVASTALGLAIGFVFGYLHFASLRMVTERILRGEWTAVPLQLVRFAVLGIALFFLATVDAVALLAAVPGIMMARSQFVTGKSGSST